MLPSTGYFKGISCPFYDSGLCERPYCHFRHVRKESQNVSNDGIESGAILKKLVSAAVQKVLQQTETSGTNVDIIPIDTATDISKTGIQQSVPKVTYNPTPIAELQKINNIDSENKDDINEQRKRHIPVPYTPRKPTSLPIRRPIDTNGASKPFIYIPPPVKYTPGSSDSVQLDPYTPKGGSDSTEKYLPGSEIELPEYKPNENTQQTSSKHNYVPSDKSVSKAKILEYKPTKVSSKSKISTVTYQPTPRSLAPCFSSDEEEPDNKKRKLSSDLNGLDDLGPEFDILDQILDEEKKELPQEPDIKTKKTVLDDCKKESKENKQSHKVSNSEKSRKSSKHDKDKIDKDKDTTKRNKDKSMSKSDDKKSTSSKNGSRSSSKNHKVKEHKSHDEKKDKNSSDKKRHSSSKGSNESSRDNKNSSKNSEKHTKQSSSSKSDSKRKDKNDHHKSHKRSKESREKSKHKKDKEKEFMSNGWADNDQADDESVDLNNEDLYDISDSDEESRTLECKRIFEEYIPTPISQPIEEPQKAEDNNEEEYIPSKKRISRTAEKNIKILPKPSLKPDYKVSAAQAMAERLAKVKEYHASKINIEAQIEDANKIDIRKNILSLPNSSSSKIRIAHVPYASTLMNAKKNISPNANPGKSEPSTSSTIAQTIKKGAQRVSHVPNEKFIDRPGVLEPLGSKIPANIRSTYLNKMIDECLKIYLSASDAYARAQHEELTTSKKCTTVPIYKNSAVMAVSRLRKELQECNGVKKSGYDCSTLQKLPQSVSGQTSNSGSWSIENKNKRVVESHEFHGAKLYNNIKKWVLSEEQLQENGYPRPHPNRDKGRAIIYGQNKQSPPKGYIRTCCRCKKDYTVDKKGFACIKEECIYHPNRKYRVRGEVKYQCCSQDGTSDGCCIAPCHVYEYVDFENLKGYVKTLPPEREMEDYGVYSLDCEMCYTTHGLDLTRVTVINSNCKVVYETLIKPLHPIIDYNTRYSGITEEQMTEVNTTLLEVQATMLAMFNSKTILIGHSLESDFKALKLIHDTVIDTSVLYPHKMGPPYKRALRNLSSEHLKKIIQNSVDGHDSAEDAMVCMELIHYKLREDLKTR